MAGLVSFVGMTGCVAGTSSPAPLDVEADSVAPDAGATTAGAADAACVALWQQHNECVEQGVDDPFECLADACAGPDAPSWCVRIADGAVDDGCMMSARDTVTTGSYCYSRSEFTCQWHSSCEVVLCTPDCDVHQGKADGTAYWDECYDAGGVFIGNYNYRFSAANSCCYGRRSWW